MGKFEYLRLSYSVVQPCKKEEDKSGSVVITDWKLEELGNEGWEMCGCRYDGTWSTYYFKREVIEAGVRYIPVQMAIMSHLSDAQELFQMGAEGRLRANNHINFAKQLVLTYPDTSIEVSENELNELWHKTIQ